MSVDPGARRNALRAPQLFNRYSYGLSNPVRFVDPNGELPLGFELAMAFTEAAMNVAEFFAGVGQGAAESANVSPIAGAAPPGSPSFESGRSVANYVADNPIVVEASVTLDTGAGFSVTGGLSAVNGTDLYAFGGVGFSMSVSPISGSITIGQVANYGGVGSYSGSFTSATGGAPVGVTVSADPFTAGPSPSAVGITFSSDVGVFSQSQTYYVPLGNFKSLVKNGGGYVLIQGELLRIDFPPE